MLGEATVNQLTDEQWKVRKWLSLLVACRAAQALTLEHNFQQTRLDAMERMVAFVGGPGVAASSGSTIVQAMAHIPGWGEKNFQVR